MNFLHMCRMHHHQLETSSQTQRQIQCHSASYFIWTHYFVISPGSTAISWRPSGSVIPRWTEPLSAESSSMHIRSLIMKLSPSPKSTTPRARKHRAESGTLITGSQKKSVKKTASSAVAALQGATDPPTKNLAFQQPPTPTIYVCMHVCVL